MEGKKRKKKRVHHKRHKCTVCGEAKEELTKDGLTCADCQAKEELAKKEKVETPTSPNSQKHKKKRKKKKHSTAVIEDKKGDAKENEEISVVSANSEATINSEATAELDQKDEDLVFDFLDSTPSPKKTSKIKKSEYDDQIDKNKKNDTKIINEIEDEKNSAEEKIKDKKENNAAAETINNKPFEEKKDIYDNGEKEELKLKIEELQKSFFNQNKYLKSSENINTVFNVLEQLNDDMKMKIEKIKLSNVELMSLHHNSVQYLREAVADKNDRLKKFSELYPEMNDGIVVDEEDKINKEIEDLKGQVAESKAEVTSWMNRYNELLAINDKLRKKIEEMFDEKDKSEDSAETEIIESSEEESPQNNSVKQTEKNDEENQSGETAVEQAQSAISGWINSIWQGQK